MFTMGIKQQHNNLSNHNSQLLMRPYTGLPQSGKNIWKLKFFPGQGKVREFGGRPGKFRKDLESQGKVREIENRWLWQAVLRKFIYSVHEGIGCLSQRYLNPYPSSLGITLKGKNLLPWGDNSFR